MLMKENRCPESLVVHGVAKSHVIADVGVQTDGGAEQQPVGLKEYILSHREEVKVITLHASIPPGVWPPRLISPPLLSLHSWTTLRHLAPCS